MRDLIKNIAAPKDTAIRYARVTRRISPTRAELTDDAGRALLADNSPGESYPVGCRVAVLDGRIIGVGKMYGTIKVYEV